MSRRGAAAVPADHRDSGITARLPNRTGTQTGSTNAATTERGSLRRRWVTPTAIARTTARRAAARGPPIRGRRSPPAVCLTAPAEKY
jgi:hypothetical protein